MDYIFFERCRSVLVCSSFMLFSLWVEIVCNIPNFFSSSGTLFTVAGLFLNIKHTAIFHLEKSVNQKYDLIDSAFGFAEEVEDKVKEAVVKNVEADELYGILLMIFGTALWGYGSYLISFLTTKNCS